MSDIAGIGSIASAAVNLAEYVIGTNSTNTVTGNSSSNTSSYADTNVSSSSDTTSTTNTSSNQTTTNSADPGVIQTLKDLASTAISNSTDPTKTQGLLSGILQSANDAMTSVFGNQKQAGVYDSSATASQTGDILSRAAAQAASSILGYDTSQQQIAGTALNQLLGATAVQNVNANSTSTTDTNQTQSASTVVSGNTSSNATSTQTTKSSSGMSVVCTWMHMYDMLSTRDYVRVMKDFKRAYPWYSRAGYITMATPMVRWLEQDCTSRKSRAVLALFGSRTRYVCGERTIKNWAAKKLIMLMVIPFGVPLMVTHWYIRLFKDSKYAGKGVV